MIRSKRPKGSTAFPPPTKVISYHKQFGGGVCGMTRQSKLGKKPFVQIKISIGQDVVKICYLEPLSHLTRPPLEWSTDFTALTPYQSML